MGLGAVKRIKTNVRHLREENEVEKDRERQRQSELEGEGRLGWAYSPWPWPATMLNVIVSYLVNMQSVCVGVCQCVCERRDLDELFQLFQFDNAPGGVGQIGRKNASICRCN